MLIAAEAGRVVGAGPHELDDLAAAVARALDDRGQLVGRAPAGVTGMPLTVQ